MRKKSIGKISIHSTVPNGDAGKLFGISWREIRGQEGAFKFLRDAVMM